MTSNIGLWKSNNAPFICFACLYVLFNNEESMKHFWSQDPGIEEDAIFVVYTIGFLNE
jgi:hypothetical protein